MTSNMEDTKLMYQPFSSILNPGFWSQLTDIKLNKLRLSKEPLYIQGAYSCNLAETLPCLASFDHNSFIEHHDKENKPSCSLYGHLTCTNIMQEFLDHNKREFLDSYGNDIWRSICDGRACAEPEKNLSKCGLLVYADLKKYNFFYWFSFPAINYPKEVYLVNRPKTSTEETRASDSSQLYQPILEVFSHKCLESLKNQYDKPNDQRTFNRAYFIIEHYINPSDGSDICNAHPLTQYELIRKTQAENNSSIYFAFTDPSGGNYPGWPLRNFIALIAVQFRINNVKLIRIRKGPPTKTSNLALHHSKIFEVKYELNPLYTACLDNTTIEKPLIIGWEKNESQQLAPKRVNLSNLLDPKKLADDAVNLNLRLMKWRLLPSLDLERIALSKCLLLGCGTLGCHIARGLLAWGVKSITIVDNAKVSYSNPVRQTLYTFEDCIPSSGTYKAEAAAANLRKIHPSVDVQSHVFAIPMPGHHIADKEIDQTRKDIALLESLIESHDAIFLLMDTRESRWLPTVISMSKQKLVINAAIGFDTYLLQRYGIRNYSNLSDEQFIQSSNSSNVIPEVSNNSQPKDTDDRNTNQLDCDKLGCYFCNDIVAPGDSTVDRTLDQQCTVSRPGVSMMVSAMAVELFASIVSSPLGALTPAPFDTGKGLVPDEGETGSDLGVVPHSVRGNLFNYHIYMPTSHYFNKCAACSPPIVNAYKISGYEFLQRVFDDPSYLEELAGLKELQNVSDHVWIIDSDEEGENGALIGTCPTSSTT